MTICLKGWLSPHDPTESDTLVGVQISIFDFPKGSAWPEMGVEVDAA
jgi:hypothetical protein